MRAAPLSEWAARHARLKLVSGGGVTLQRQQAGSQHLCLAPHFGA